MKRIASSMTLGLSEYVLGAIVMDVSDYLLLNSAFWPIQRSIHIEYENPLAIASAAESEYIGSVRCRGSTSIGAYTAKRGRDRCSGAHDECSRPFTCQAKGEVPIQRNILIVTGGFHLPGRAHDTESRHKEMAIRALAILQDSRTEFKNSSWPILPPNPLQSTENRIMRTCTADTVM
jgi:hypothetical protein